MPETSVVLDTNIFVAAGFNAQSRSACILEQVKSGRLCMIWNETTRDEVRAILRKIPPLSWERAASLFRPEARFEEEIHPEDYSFVPDPDDREFLALAEAADAALISHDDDLLDHRGQAGVPVLTSAEFLDRYGRA